MTGLPEKGAGYARFFGPTGSTIAQGVQVWQKPKGVGMCMFVVWGGGGGGGAGHSRTAGTAGGGGGSGACSGIARFLVPAIFVPDRLFIQVGHGGVGGTPGVNGTAGIQTYITTCPPLTAGTVAPLPNIWLNSGVNAPGGGGSSTSTTGGTNGSIPTIAVVQPHHHYGQWSATVGKVGAVGAAGTGTSGGTITAWESLCFTAGAAGGGCTTTDYAGGKMYLAGRLSVPGRLEMQGGGGPSFTDLPGGAAGGGDGNAGLMCLSPFLSTGGTGGGTNNSGQGGHGGNGGYGCGGGGGGAGTTGGNGGNGGPGGAMITCW